MYKKSSLRTCNKIWFKCSMCCIWGKCVLFFDRGSQKAFSQQGSYKNDDIANISKQDLQNRLEVKRCKRRSRDKCYCCCCSIVQVLFTFVLWVVDQNNCWSAFPPR